MFRYHILVRNGSTVPQIPISGHIMTFRTLSATLKKFEFLQYLTKISILSIFISSKYDVAFGRKWPKI